MVRQTLYTFAFWTMLLSICYGQGSFESTPHWNADRNDNFFEDGKIVAWDDQGVPLGWDENAAFKAGHATSKRNYAGTMVLTCPTVGGETSVATTIDLPRDAKYVTIIARMRDPKIVPRESETAGAGMVYTLKTDDEKKVTFPRVEPDPSYGSLGSWKAYRSTIKIPSGFTKLELRATIVDSEGFLEVDSVLVVSSKPDFQAPEKLEMLRTAIKNDDAKAAKKLLKETPELLELRDGKGPWTNPTPLVTAAVYNAKAVAKELVQLGADLEASEDSWDKTPLGICCVQGRVEIAKTLIDGGAKTSSGGVKKREYARLATNGKKQSSPERAADYDKILELISQTNERKKLELDAEASTVRLTKIKMLDKQRKLMEAQIKAEAAYVAALTKSGSEQHELQQKIERAEEQAFFLARSLINASLRDEKFKRPMRLKLQKAIQEAFDLRMQFQTAQLDDAEAKLAISRQRLTRRQALANQIVERRANELLGTDETKWSK